MATDLDNLLARRSSILTQLTALSTSAPGGGPNTFGEGIRVDQQGYRKSLLDELKTLNDMISVVGGPYEYITHGRI